MLMPVVAITKLGNPDSFHWHTSEYKWNVNHPFFLKRIHSKMFIIGQHYINLKTFSSIFFLLLLNAEALLSWGHTEALLCLPKVRVDTRVPVKIKGHRGEGKSFTFTVWWIVAHHTHVTHRCLLYIDSVLTVYCEGPGGWCEGRRWQMPWYNILAWLYHVCSGGWHEGRRWQTPGCSIRAWLETWKATAAAVQSRSSREKKKLKHIFITRWTEDKQLPILTFWGCASVREAEGRLHYNGHRRSSNVLK